MIDFKTIKYVSAEDNQIEGENGKKSLERWVMGKCDILNLEWSTDSRDTNIVEPVLSSLENRFHYSVERRSIWYPLFGMLYFRPKCLIISNSNGADINYIACKVAKTLGIRVVTLISEGQYFDRYDETGEYVDNLFWGWDFEHRVVWDLKLLWSKKLYDQFRRYIKDFDKMNVKVSGGTGFDRYSFSGFIKPVREIIPEKYKKIVMLIGYGFDVYIPMNDSRLSVLDKDEYLEEHNQKDLVRDIYDYVIGKNTDVFFILKHHPASTDLNDTEFFGLNEKYENTIELQNEYPIDRLIYTTDLIMAVGSTVCMEAWIMGKTTIMVCPKGIDLLGSIYNEGNPVVNNSEEATTLIDEFFERNSILEFEQLAQEREKVMKDQIQNADGFNYLRAAKMIDEELKKERRDKNKNTFPFLARELVREIKRFIIMNTCVSYVYRDYYNNLQERMRSYSEQKRYEEASRYKVAIDEYEKKNYKIVQSILGDLK